MPIIINELVFKGTIGSAKKDDRVSPGREKPTGRSWRALVDVCVEEVLRVLRQEKER